jgi:hypothetical protein
MEEQYAIPVALGASILLAAVSTSLLPLQFASGTTVIDNEKAIERLSGPSIMNKPANSAGTSPPSLRSQANPAGTPSNMTAGPSANTTGAPPSLRSPANTTGAPP